MNTLLIAWSAFFIDTIFGDPRSKFHPVVLIGSLISFLEKFLLKHNHCAKKQFYNGIVMVVCSLGIVYMVSDLLLTVAGFLFGPYSLVLMGINALLLSFTISPRSLAEAGLEIRNYLLADDLKNARFKVGWIVGRDTQNLNVSDITRATVETVAENIVDGIISPFFYFLLGGLPLAILYRTANTMDSMIGYKNKKYLHFGCAAARLDDVLNFIPARITAILLIIVAYLLKLNWENAFHMMRRDAKKHPSPNGGYSEATVAGALNIRLGGLNYYFGSASFRAYMGNKQEELQPKHITKTIQMMYGVSILFLLLAFVVWMIGGQIL
ncbi:adenosylcobinamide-phosphate synthase [Propionispira arboris]|uniref:Cobalamin biosynthesis protein CobD n=1 Tax=Propionispira arboris TaxID=84035 RepID=A0A1H6W4D2_9FIRM|nr:adenosylcobinamide-phosphate synthase CbiB [Propionispira arboris]SEJ10656.1 adenosylcobinamide-phosphate synthase [Propionispira arboris]